MKLEASASEKGTLRSPRIIPAKVFGKSGEDFCCPAIKKLSLKDWNSDLLVILFYYLNFEKSFPEVLRMKHNVTLHNVL